jgi:hypothetical protein
MEEEYRAVCTNPWCKAHYTYRASDIRIVDGSEVRPTQCRKCLSFANEMSGGVEWKDKEYEGSRFDGMSHQIRYKVTNYK